MANVSNRAVSDILSELGEHLAIQGVAFKPRAYEQAAAAVAGLDRDLRDIYKEGGLKALEEIPGVGVSIAEKIEELLATGHLKYYDELKRKMPADLSELMRVEGLGPKSVKILYEKLGIKNIAELEAAARGGEIGALKGFGPKSEENILKSIAFLKRSGGRFVLGSAMPEIRMIEDRLRGLRGVAKVTVAGSVRRRKDTIGDIDILVVSEHPRSVMDYFVSMPEVVDVSARGETKSAVKLKMGLSADLRVVPPESYGAALNYFTGSKDHNIALREMAVKRGWKLNEYGLFHGEKMIAGKSEEELYRALGLDYIEPELRENAGELERAGTHTLPTLIGYDALRGDLQVQTDWTDGSDSIEAMARAAIARGLDYIAITDHTKRLAMTHGLDEVRIQKQWLEIDAVNKKFNGKIRVLKGSECDILKDGSLDLPDEVLSRLDVVGASVHSYFNLVRADQTKRIERAIGNPHVDILFHPTGRILNRRDAYDVDIESVISVAKKTGTALEVDAYPDRADLRDEHIRKCVEAGVKLSIDSDAHSPSHFAFLEYGIAQARRGWATREDIVNAWPVQKMLQWLK